MQVSYAVALSGWFFAPLSGCARVMPAETPRFRCRNGRAECRKTSIDLYEGLDGPMQRGSTARRCDEERVRRQLPGSRTLPRGLGLKGLAKAFDQAFLAVGLGEEADGAGAKRPSASPFIGKGRNEDNRHAMAVGDQSALQIDAAQARHLDV